MKNKINIAISALSIGLMSSYALAEIPSKTESETRTETVAENHIKKITIDGETFIERIIDDIVNINSEDAYKRQIDFIDEKVQLELSEKQKMELISLVNKQKHSLSPNMQESPKDIFRESNEFEKEIEQILSEAQVEKLESIYSLEIILFDNTFEVNRDNQLIINGNVIDINQEEIEKMNEQEAQEYFDKIVNYVDVEPMKLGFSKIIEEVMTHMQKQMEMQMQKQQKNQ